MPDTQKPYIELNAFIKLKCLAATGGMAKVLIRSGKVLVDGQPETRNKRKLFGGEKVSAEGKNYKVEKDVLKMGLLLN